MSPETILAARWLFVLLALAGLGVVCTGLRSYARDAFRQRAFAIRDELFDYAASGALSFNDAAYWRLRLMMNRMIRYSHRLTFGEAILPVLISILMGKADTASPFHDQWLKALEHQPADVRKRLMEIHEAFADALVSHLLKSTPQAWPLFLIAIAVLGFREVLKNVAARTPALEEEAVRRTESAEWRPQAA